MKNVNGSNKQGSFNTYRSLFIATLLSTVVAGVVVGCGGGGGGGKGAILGTGGNGNGNGNPNAAPIVTSVTPLQGSTVPTNLKAITATFSKAMNPATLNGTTFTVECPSGSAFTGTVSYLAPSKTATLLLPALPNLPISELCTATITTGAQDTTAKPLAVKYEWSFSTGLVADTTAPTIISTGAFDGETGLAVNRNSTATFSETMNPATLDSPATTYAVTCLPPCVSPVAGVVSYIGTTVTFNPDADLLPNTTYTSTVSTAATDTAGNALIAGVVPNPWSWTTGASGDVIPPTVTSSNPADLDTGVCINKSINATFSEDMTPATIDTLSFTLQLTGPPLGPVLGAIVSYDLPTNVATLDPTLDLLPNTQYTATITTAVTDLAGNPMTINKVWSFTTGVGICTTPVTLGSLSTFVAVAGAGLTNSNSSGVTTLNGDVGLSPTATCLGDGIPCTITNPVINGTFYANDPGGVAAQAKTDLTAAYVDAMSRPPGTTVNDISGMVLAPGVYTSASTMSIAVSGTVTLDAQGDANAVWIFQIGSSLTVNNNAQVLLINGAQAKNVFWGIFASSTIGGNVDFKGSVLAGASNSVGTDSVVLGRLLCTTGQITLLSNTITLP